MLNHKTAFIEIYVVHIFKKSVNNVNKETLKRKSNTFDIVVKQVTGSVPIIKDFR